MKKFLVTLFLALCATISFAQSQEDESEKARPMRDTKVVRNVTEIDIEGKLYEDVEVTMKSISADYLIFNNDRVKVTIRNKDGKKVWKKTFYNAYMYVFSNGQVQIGKPNFDQMVIFKSMFGNSYNGVIREYEGVY